MIDDPDQKMSLEDCRAIHERTADWLVKDFGAFEQKKEKGVEIVKTAKGSEYSYYLDGTTFIASFQKNLSDKRRILLVSHYRSEKRRVGQEVVSRCRSSSLP